MAKELVLDCNVWIEILTDSTSKLQKILFFNESEYRIILSSYMIVEILKVVKRISGNFNLSLKELKGLFWDFTQKKNVIVNFDSQISDALVNEVKNKTEIILLAKLLDLEPKDVPYILVAYNYKADLITEDGRSLIDKRNLIKQKLDLNLLSISEFILKS